MSWNLSRRRFLATSAAAVAGATLLPRFAKAAPYDPKKYGGYNIGIQSYALREYKIPEVIENARQLGFEHIEFSWAHFSLHVLKDNEIADIKQKLGDDMHFRAHGVNKFKKDHEFNRKIFLGAKAFGLTNLSADPDPDSFESLDKLVKEFDIRIAIHNHGPKSAYDKIADVLNAIKDHDPRIGACADLGHFIRSGEDPVKAITLFEGRLYGLHLKDYDAPKGDAKGVILGKGVLDVPAVFKALKKVNFPTDGVLSLEYEENPKNPLKEIEECLAVASEAAQKAAS